MSVLFRVGVLISCVGVSVGGTVGGYPCRPAELKEVAVTGGFWLPRLETNRLVTLRTDFRQCEKSGRIANFSHAARRETGTFEGLPCNDADVFRVIEGASYTLAAHPDAELEAYLDGLIADISKAQEPDGYLYTARTLGYFDPDSKDWKRQMMGPERFTSLSTSHELFNAGQLYEAAIAFWEATGKRTLLDVAVKNADFLCGVFGAKPGQNRNVPGHEEPELALCKLYRATGERRYLDLAKTFLDMRGRKDFRGNSYGLMNQDHIPAVQQREAVGHAVRAANLYCGMADVAAILGDAAYREAVDVVWDDVVGRKLALNGGIGSRKDGEAFGDAYELPNRDTYLETCAAIENALWNERMFLLHADAKYVDVLERILYNGILPGVSLGGDKFFYPNPLASAGGYERSSWFECSCCPVNLVRLLPQVPGFAYATKGDTLYWNLFIDSDATLHVAGESVGIRQRTEYPWEGRSVAMITPAGDGGTFTLAVRIPGWAVGRPVPSDLYTQTMPGSLADVAVTVNGVTQELSVAKGFLPIRRAWHAGDTVTVSFAMPVRRIRANAAVEADAGHLAVERGPIVYCAEGIDNGGLALGRPIPADAAFSIRPAQICGERFPALETTGPQSVRLVPYFMWCNRGAGEMATWFPTNAPRRVLFLGNSITLHYPKPEIGWTNEWGMAASALTNDYSHLVAADITRRAGSAPAVRIRNIADFEHNYATWDVEAQTKGDCDFDADVVILAIAENVPALKTPAEQNAFRGAVTKMLTLLTARRKPLLIVRSSWGPDPNAVTDGILREVCKEHGGRFVYLGRIADDRSKRAPQFANGAVAMHPGDSGMRAIADAIFSAMEE